MIYALDTNAISYAIRGEGKVGARLVAQGQGEIIVPIVALYEILNWRDARKTTRPLKARIDAFLAPLTVAPFDEAAARRSSTVFLALSAAGTMINALDVLIAGIALANGATLVTRNVRHLSRVPGLSVEDWYG